MCRKTDYEFPCNCIESRVNLCTYKCYLVEHREPRKNRTNVVKVDFDCDEPHKDFSTCERMYFKRSVIRVDAGLSIRKKQRVVKKLVIRYDECDECSC